MPAYIWWDANGACVPELQVVARMVLAQPASSSVCERINGEFAFVKDVKRNRLSHTKANKLVALFHNLRLLYQMKKTIYSEVAMGWNDEENKTGLSKFGVNHYSPVDHIIPSQPPLRPPVAFEDGTEASDGMHFLE